MYELGLCGRILQSAREFPPFVLGARPLDLGTRLLLKHALPGGYVAIAPALTAHLLSWHQGSPS